MIIRIVPATCKYKYYASTVMQNLDIQSLLTKDLQEMVPSVA